MPKATLWIIVAALVLLFVILFRAGVQPARVVIINQSGRTVQDLVVASTKFDLLRNGETRVVRAAGDQRLVIAFRGQQQRRWESPQPLAPGSATVFAIMPGDRVVERKPSRSK